MSCDTAFCFVLAAFFVLPGSGDEIILSDEEDKTRFRAFGGFWSAP